MEDKFFLVNKYYTSILFILILCCYNLAGSELKSKVIFSDSFEQDFISLPSEPAVSRLYVNNLVQDVEVKSNHSSKENFIQLPRQLQDYQENVQISLLLPQQNNEKNNDEYEKTLYGRIANIEIEQQKLTGKVEQQNFTINKLENKIQSLHKIIDVLSLKKNTSSTNIVPTNTVSNNQVKKDPLAVVENSKLENSNINPKEITHTKIANSQTSSSVDENSFETYFGDGKKITKTSLWNYATMSLVSSNYAQAKSAFLRYIKLFPADSKKTAAEYKIGEIQLITGLHAGAAQTFLKFVRNNSKDPLTPRAFIKLGEALNKLGKQSDACQIFRSAKEKFSATVSGYNELVDMAMWNSGC